MDIIPFAFMASPPIPPAYVKTINAGVGFAFALKYSGEGWAWGTNGSGQLGFGGSSSSGVHYSPEIIIGGHSFAAIRPGEAVLEGSRSAPALDTVGQAWARSSNSSGNLGLESDNSGVHYIPEAVIGGHIFTTIDAGDDFTLAKRLLILGKYITPLITIATDY